MTSQKLANPSSNVLPFCDMIKEMASGLSRANLESEKNVDTPPLLKWR